MRTLLLLIPFLAAPFILPGVAAGLRILAFLAIGLSSLHWLTPGDELTDSPQNRFSPFHGLILIGVVLYYFSIYEPLRQHIMWPVCASGVLILLAVARERVPVFAGLYLTVLSLIVLLVLNAYNPSAFPDFAFEEIVELAYPPNMLTLDSGIQLPTAIRSPSMPVQTLASQMLVAVISILFVSLGFWAKGKRFRGLQWAPFCAWIGLSFPFVGRDIFLLAGITVIIFGIATGRIRRSISIKKLALVTAFLAFCAAGYQGYFDRAPSLMAQSNFFVGQFLPQQTSVHTIDTIPKDTLFYPDDKVQNDWVIPSVIGIGFLLLIAEIFFTRDPKDLRFPAGISLLILTGLSAGPSINIWLYHPFSWLGIACLQSAERKESDDAPEISEMVRNNRWTPIVVTGAAGLLGIAALWNLFPNWQSERALARFEAGILSGDRPDLSSAYLRAPYRGDIASLYATESIMVFYPQIALPPPPEPEKLEALLRIGARRGYTSLLGYARLSSLYFLLSQGERSIDVLDAAIEQTPNEIYMHEILADTLETLGRWEQSLIHYRICANLNPLLPRIREKMARVYGELGKTEEAKKEWDKLRTLDPTKGISQR